MKLDHYTRKKLGFWWRDQKIRNFFIVSGFIIIIIIIIKRGYTRSKESTVQSQVGC